MTTEAAAQHYLARHLRQFEHSKNVILNPHDKPVDELPVIMGFNKGGAGGFLSAVLITEDGHCVGGHCCSSESYMPHDLGIIEGGFEKEGCNKHYPDGFRMEWVPTDDIKDHVKLNKAFDLSNTRHAEKSE